MKKQVLLSIILGLFAAIASYLLLIIDVLTFNGNVYAWLFVPINILIAIFVVFFKKPSVAYIVLRGILYVTGYILLYISGIHEYIFDIANNYSAAYLGEGTLVGVIINTIVICITFLVAGIVRAANNTCEKAPEN
ncbi:MAG: hypothetical protein IJE16_08580 [Ruminococcus sp.]|nr:hypothetical protein [Ruminococcus sp.]